LHRLRASCYCVSVGRIIPENGSYLCLGLAGSALKTEHNLLGGLRPLVEDGLGLTSVTGLLTVVTTLTLSEQRSLASLVLCQGFSMRAASERFQDY
jgi:hypothetical protein